MSLRLNRLRPLAAGALLCSVSVNALAAEKTAIIFTQSSYISYANGLKTSLEAAGYTVTSTTDISSVLANIPTATQVWDMAITGAMSEASVTAYTSYLQSGGGLFLLGENAAFEPRNTSVINFISNMGGGTVTYGGQTVIDQYVTTLFNGDGLIVPNSSTSMFVNAAGTFGSSGNGTYITTTGANGTGSGTGIAFGVGSLSNAPTGKLLTYLDVNTFTAEANSPLGLLVNRMIGFVAGEFQVDPDLPPVESGPSVIDDSQPSFNLDDDAASGSEIVFDGGTLELTRGGSADDIDVTADISIGENGAYIDTAGGTSTLSGDISGDGGMMITGGGTISLTGDNSHTGGTLVTDYTLLEIDDAGALGTGDVVLQDGALGINSDTTISNDMTLMAGLNGILTGDNEVTIAGDITGSGGFIKNGAGTLTLTGDNSYTGDTAILGGTLVGNADNIGGDVTNNAALVFNQIVNGTFEGAISGSGSVTKTGAGVLTLTGDNSYTGPTTIEAGTLVGNADNIGGDVTNNAALVFNQIVNGTFEGAISGSGSVTKSGAGTLTLTGDNSYTGPTIIEAGTLVGNAGNIGLNITNNGDLIINQVVNGSYNGVITGAGTVIKEGEGRLSLTGTHDYTGDTVVDAGRLAVNGSVSGSTVIVNAGGSVGGNGVVGGLIIRSAAMAAPGNSIGTLNVDTTVLFEDDSFYEVEVNAEGASDRIIADGLITIEGGTVQVLAENGNYNPRTRYEILTSAVGVDGRFDDVTSNFAFLTPTLGYDSNAVTLTLTRNDLRFGDAGVTPNQRQTGNAIDASFGSDSAVYDALVDLTVEGAQRAFDSASGEVHASLLSLAAQQTDEMRRALLDRLDTPGSDRLTLWTDIVGGRNTLDGDRNSARLRSDARGFRVGLEGAIGDFRVGVAGGYSDGDLTIAARASQADIESVSGAAYAGGSFGSFNIRAGASYTGFEVDTRRTATVGVLAQTLEARYNGSVVQSFAEAGSQFPLGIGSVEPFAGINAIWLKNDAFSEQGGNLAIKSQGDTRKQAWSTLGMKASFPIGGAAAARIKAGWQHALTDVPVVSTHSFVAGGPAFVIEGTPLAKDAALVDAGLNWAISSGISIGVSYTGTLANQGQSHSARAALAVRF